MKENPVTFANSPPAPDRIMQVLAEIYAREKGLELEVRKTIESA